MPFRRDGEATSLCTFQTQPSCAQPQVGHRGAMLKCSSEIPTSGFEATGRSWRRFLEGLECAGIRPARGLVPTPIQCVPLRSDHPFGFVGLRRVNF